MMLHPAYELLLLNGIAPEHISLSPTAMANRIVTALNDTEGAGIVAYSEWATVRVFYDSHHVSNLVIDDQGITFEFDRGGPMLNDPRSNRVIYAVISAVACQQAESAK